MGWGSKLRRAAKIGVATGAGLLAGGTTLGGILAGGGAGSWVYDRGKDSGSANPAGNSLDPLADAKAGTYRTRADEGYEGVTGGYHNPFATPTSGTDNTALAQGQADRTDAMAAWANSMYGQQNLGAVNPTNQQVGSDWWRVQSAGNPFMRNIYTTANQNAANVQQRQAAGAGQAKADAAQSGAASAANQFGQTMGATNANLSNAGLLGSSVSRSAQDANKLGLLTNIAQARQAVSTAGQQYAADQAAGLANTQGVIASRPQSSFGDISSLQQQQAALKSNTSGLGIVKSGLSGLAG